MNKIVPVLVLILILGVVGISGCVSSDNNTTPVTNNTTNTSYASTPVAENTTATTAQNNATASDTSNVATPASSKTSASAAYIGNSNTHKFHLASCHYVSKMNSENKVYFNTRQDAINAGYTPCKVCNP
ncbi:MAG: hypothetical protein K8E24_006980 [Methanobacterium paludis]|nr:hypothetical protein [Methanobacterium paludis]